MAKTKTTAAPARRLTLREVRLIQFEALTALNEKASKAICAANTKVREHNAAIIRAAIHNAIIRPSFEPALEAALIASVQLHKASTNDIRFESYRDDPLSKFLSSSVKQYIKANSLKEAPEVVRLAPIHNPMSRSTHASQYVWCLKSEATAYVSLIDEINGLELTFALGADAASVLADLKARIAKL